MYTRLRSMRELDELNNEHRMDEMLSALFGDNEVTSFKETLISELST